MCRLKLLCGGAIASMLLVGAVQTEAVAAWCQWKVPANEQDAEDSSYGRVEQDILKDNPDISVRVDYGIDGYALSDEECQVMAEIYTDKAFKGKVSVIPDYNEDSDNQPVIYSQMVDWAEKTDNQVKFYVSELGYGNLKVQVTDDSGQLVYSESDTISVSGYEELVTVGVLDDSGEICGILDDARVKSGEESINVRGLNMTTESFPDSVQGLRVVNYIVLDGYNTDQMSALQQSALKEWVMEGGTLVLSLGEGAEDILSGLKIDLLSCELAGMSLKNLYIQSDKGTRRQYKNVPFADITVTGTEADTSQKNVVKTYDSLAGVCSEDLGCGRILYVPYSLGAKPISGGNDELKLWENILKIGYTDTINSRVKGSYYDNSINYGISTAISANDRKMVPPASLILILVVYLIACGPLSYVLLKKLKRRELIWITMPACAIIGTCGIYLVSREYRVTKPLEMTFESADISGDTAKYNMYAYIIGAKAGKYDIDVDEAYGNVRVLEGAYGNSIDSRLVGVEHIVGDNGVNVKFDTHVPFAEMSLVASNVSKNDIGKFGSSLKLYTDGIEGTVVNDTEKDMTDLVVMADGYYYCVESLKAGESVYIDRSGKYKMVGGMSIDSMKDYYRNRYGSNYSLNEEASAMMSRNYYMMLRLRQQPVSVAGTGKVAMWASIDKGGNSDTKFVKFVVYDIQTLDYEDVDGVYYSNIFVRDVNAMEQQDYDTDDYMMYSSQADIDIKFQKDDHITKIMRSDSDKNKSGVVVKAYNYETGIYDEVFTHEVQDIQGDMLDVYMRNDELKLRIISPHNGEEYLDTYLPRISAIGGGE